MKQHFLVIAGCGPGSADYITPAVRDAVGWAEVLVGARRLLDLFPDSPAEKIAVGADVDQILKEIEARRAIKRIVVLVTGDPGLCSLAQPVIRRFGRETCRVIPAVSSMQTAFARLGLDWQDATIIDAHGEDPSLEPESLCGKGKIAVLAGRKDAARWIARLAAVLGGNYRIYLCQDLTLPGEQVKQVAAGEFSSGGLPPRSIVVFVREDQLK